MTRCRWRPLWAHHHCHHHGQRRHGRWCRWRVAGVVWSWTLTVTGRDPPVQRAKDKPCRAAAARSPGAALMVDVASAGGLVSTVRGRHL